MPFRFAILFIAFLAYVLSSGVVSKHGSGLDPLGTSSTQDQPSQPPSSPDHGSGLDPLG